MFVNQKNSDSRPTKAYAKVIADIAKDGVCPFCSEHLKTYHKLPLREEKYWWVTDNMYPYKPNKHHRLLIHKEHIAHLNELSNEAWAELIDILKDESTDLAMTGGSYVMRFGDTKFTGASVSHLHANLVQSDPDDPVYDQARGVITRIG